MASSLIVLLAMPQLRFLPSLSACQLLLKHCLATQDCIPAVILALSLARKAQGPSPNVVADALAVARHKKMPLGALAEASSVLYALGSGNTDRPYEPNQDAEALPTAFNTADDALPSANQNSQYAAYSQEEADVAGAKEYVKQGADLLAIESASQHQQLCDEQHGGVQLSTSHHMTPQEWAVQRLLQACQLQHPTAHTNSICLRSEQGQGVQQPAGTNTTLGGVIGILQMLTDHVRSLNDLMYTCTTF